MAKIFRPLTLKGRTTIDHIVTSPQIVTTVNRCGILPSIKYYASDHHSIYVDIPNKQIFGGLNYPMAEKRKWKITTQLASINANKQDVSSALRNTEFQTLLCQKTRVMTPRLSVQNWKNLIWS
eukprot:2038857-Ditylum_brightwellii.AAC.1